MNFVSSSFFLFLPIFLVGALVLNGSSRLWFYTVMSYFFYAWSFPPYVLLLFTATLVNFLAGKWIMRSSIPCRKKLFLAVSLIVSLGTLGFYKYIGFFKQITNFVLSIFGANLKISLPEIILPIGISFYTFQAISYSIDIYRQRVEPAKSFLEFACYVAFFPQLVAGPIVRSHEFLSQIPNHEPFRKDDIIRGSELLLIGFFKKCVIADNAARFVDPIFASSGDFGGGVIWLGSFFFAVQIYCDFSGYTDIARGLGRILGFEFPENFRWPYFSASIKEFWQRWHITLSFYIRDYLYIPLGGSRVSHSRLFFNLLTTWFLVGLWHGASYNYICWGLYFGFLLFFERFLTKLSLPSFNFLRSPVFKVPFTFLLVTFGWVIFRNNELGNTYLMWKKMLLPAEGFLQGLPDYLGWGPPILSLGALLIVHWITYTLRYNSSDYVLLQKCPYFMRVILLALVTSLIIVFAGQERAFIYFQF